MSIIITARGGSGGSGTPVNVNIPTETDWVAYTPIFGNLGTVTNINCFWRQLGDSVQIKFAFTPGTGVGSDARIGLPSGLTSSSTKIAPSGGGRATVVGSAAYASAGAVSFYALAEPSVTYFGIGLQDAGDAGVNLQNGNVIAADIDGFATIPIQGWSANTNYTINSISVPLVAARIVSTAGDVTSGASTVFIPTTVEQDTTSSYSSITGQFTCPSDGTYTVTGQINTPDQQGGNFIILYALKNGTNIAKVATQNNTVAIEAACGLLVTSTVPCLMGDTLQVNILNNGAQPLSTGAGENWIQFLKVG